MHIVTENKSGLKNSMEAPFEECLNLGTFVYNTFQMDFVKLSLEKVRIFNIEEPRRWNDMIYVLNVLT